jgi:uncharacterized protein (UPF0297 family)
MAYLLQRLEKKKNCESILKRSYNHSLGLPDEGINPVNTIGATLESTNLATSSIAPQNVNVIENLVTNYDNEAENLIRAFINNKDAVNQIVVYLKGQNPEYIKELVLNWDTYKPIFLDLRGKDLSIGRVADQIATAIGANVNQKVANELIIANPNRTSIPMLTNGPNPRPDQTQINNNSFTTTQLKSLEDLYFQSQGNDAINGDWENATVLRAILCEILQEDKGVSNSRLRHYFQRMDAAEYDQLNAYYNKIHSLGTNRKDMIKAILLLRDDTNLLSDEQIQCINDANTMIGTETYLYGTLNQITDQGLQDSSTFFLACLFKAITAFTNTKMESTTKALHATKNSAAVQAKIAQIDRILEQSGEIWKVDGMSVKEIGQIKEKKKRDLIKFMNDTFKPYSMATNNKWDTKPGYQEDSAHFSTRGFVKFFLQNAHGKFTQDQVKALITKLAELTADAPLERFRIKSYDENIGLGLTSSAKHRFGDKGKFYIDSKVLDGGLLEIRYTKNGHLANIKSVMVSRKLKDIICGLLAGRSVDHSEYLKLTPSEKHIISLVSAKFGQGLNEGADHDLNNEFEILKGELMGGNNSVLIKTKLRHMIYLQADTGKISRQSANKMIADLGLT